MGATSGAQAAPTAEVAAERAALAVAAKGSAMRAVDTPRALRRTRSTCVWARRRDEKGARKCKGRREGRLVKGGVWVRGSNGRVRVAH